MTTELPILSEKILESTAKERELINQVSAVDLPVWDMLLTVSIPDGDMEAFDLVMELLDFKSMDRDEFLLRFAQLVESIINNEQEELFLKKAIATWQQYSDLPTSMDTLLFSRASVPNYVLYKIAIFLNKTLFAYIKEIIDWIDASDIEVALTHINELLNEYDPTLGLQTMTEEQLLYEWETLHDQTIDQEAEEGSGNLRVRDFVEQYYASVSDYQDVPKWVKDFGIRNDQGKIPKENDVLLKDVGSIIEFVPDADAYAQWVAKKEVTIDPQDIQHLDYSTQPANLSYNDAYTKAKSEFENLSEEEKKIKAKPFIINTYRKNLQKDFILFRIYGPCHPYLPRQLHEPFPCNILGGCRMFYCTEFEKMPEDEEGDEYSVDWFTGSCEYCKKKIRSRYHALRMPLDMGGWQGCYCSEVCVNQSTNSVGEIELLKTTIAYLEKYGIQVRR